MSYTALYNACVLYPAPVRDILIQVALTDLFRARWTNEIHEEWIRNLLDNRDDLSREQLERTKNLMNKHASDALISNYKYLLETVDLPDKDDNHVLAAAIHGDVDVIVTYNLNDFPEDNLEAQHPDTFLTHLIDLNQPKVCQAVKKVRERLTNPKIPVEEYFDILVTLELSQFTSYLKDYQELL